MMLSWQKVDAIPGWFGAHSYALWRSLLDFQAENVRGNLFEIGVWRGRSATRRLRPGLAEIGRAHV